MPLGRDIDLSPSHIVLDGDPAPPPPKGHSFIVGSAPHSKRHIPDPHIDLLKSRRVIAWQIETVG